jgi:hypothetical protein
MDTSWNDCAKNEVIRSINEERNVVHAAKQRKANCIGTAFRNMSLKGS